MFVCVNQQKNVLRKHRREHEDTHKNKDGDKTHCLARVCVFKGLTIPVKMHTFLSEHMWLIFIAPALTSPWQPNLRGATSNHRVLSGNPEHRQGHTHTHGRTFPPSHITTFALH